MIEQLKTAVLTLLVLASLVQSYFLAYSYPKFDPLMPPDEYVKTDMLGTQASIEEMLFSDQLVLHLGNGQHTVLYPNTQQYNDVWENVKQRFMEDFRKTNALQLGLDLEEVGSKQQGVEIRFRDGLPMNVLQRVMQLKGDLINESDLITRIWIFAKDANEVRTILFTDTPNTLYEVTRADFTVKDIERFVTVDPDFIPYRKAAAGDFYLPTKPLPMTGYQMGFTQFTADQLKRTFFVDPSVTRNLTERDGSEIHTDGKRGLQLKNEQHWMTYSDPVAPADSKLNILDNLLSAVQFINQHGGWNGTYAVQKVPQRMLSNHQAFVFRQYYGSYPIINTGNENMGFMKISLQKGIVASYERSIITPDTKEVIRKEVQLAGGEPLEQKLAQFTGTKQVYSVFPGYRPVIREQTMELVPAWAVELRDGTYEFLE
ncbi:MULTISPECIES: YycH family regulatory protein [Paenibacillus]|uniref:YycH family regulatory protein n=1 Tax=Paenibacillus TaxID=44249 RepID=UPI00087E090C|nr:MULTISPECIES: two-component system activity regulator YycH [Paenibacillus]NTZ16098.1 hypothetical protein [Paenibacillus sp. JMULE4]SDJ40516.1 Two-component signal transduction system YycFG, regulatory protein YycH [Paenibacillus naphthalenovorans]